MPEAASNPAASRSGIAALRRRLRPRPPGAITALDVDGQTLWVAQATPRGPRVGITRVDSAPLSLASDADRTDPVALGQAIANALTSLRVKPGAVVMGVPRAQIVLRTLNLPVVNDIRELASMVHLQVSKDLPFRPEDAVIDFKVHRQLNPPPPPEAMKQDLTASATPRLEILVAAVHRDVVAFCEQTAEAAGLKLVALGLRAYANARCLQACEMAAGDQVVALVSLRPDEVNIDVMSGEALLFSRGVAVPAPREGAPAGTAPDGSEEPESAPVSVENFVDGATIEVVRTLHSYGGMAARSPVVRVVVTGARAQEEAVVQALSRRLSIPCSLLDPVSAFNLETESLERARGAVAAIGLALGFTDSAGLPFDFLDPKRPAVQRDMGRIRVLAGVAAVAALFLVLLVVRSQLTQRRMAVYREVQAALSEAEKKRSIYRLMHQQASTIDEWKREDRNWLDHYAYLSAILPPSEEVYITSFATTPQGVLRLGVQARSGEILSKIDKQLRSAGYEIRPLAITPGADRHGYDFSSTVELMVPEKMTFDLAKVRPPVRPVDDASLEPGVLKGGRP
jgi:type IV pilus assembly protein PilM